MSEEIKMSPELKKFFQRLLEIKQFVKESSKKSNEPVLEEIFLKLDELIKEK